MMLNEIYAGKSVIVPEQPVNVNGEDYLRWYVVDENGNTVDWDENGMHQAAWEYTVVRGMAVIVAIDIAKNVYKYGMVAVLNAVFDYIKDQIIQTLLKLAVAIGAIVAGLSATLLLLLMIYGFLLALEDLIAGDPPLNTVLFETRYGSVELQLEGGEKLAKGIFIKELDEQRNLTLQIYPMPRSKLILTTDTPLLMEDDILEIPIRRTD